MKTARFNSAQAERTLELCAGIRKYPGMYIAPFNWSTADAYWSGYMRGMDGEPFADFRPWGLDFVGAPTSNTSPIYELQRQHGLDADTADQASLTRERATEIAGLVCAVVEAYVHAHR